MLREFAPCVKPRRRRRNLVLVTDREIDLEDDFRRIAAFVRETAPDVVPFVLPRARLSHWQRLKLATRPTLIFSPGRFTRPRLYRGVRRHGSRILKRQEYAALERAGVPVPRWTLLTEKCEPDLSEFGPYVVVKPDLGWRGAEVKIMRKGRVRWTHPAMHQGTPSDWIVQEFVYTGRWPVSYRVTTLFCQVISAWRAEASHDRRPLEARYDFRAVGGQSIVSSHRGCTFTLQAEADVLEIACRAASVFPEIPLLGVDVVRDAGTGRLFVLEVNASGYVWHFSSKAGRSIQRDFDLCLESQFDGIRKSAMILISEARRLAR
jgi:hypothetical protein